MSLFSSVDSSNAPGTMTASPATMLLEFGKKSVRSKMENIRMIMRKNNGLQNGVKMKVTLRENFLPLNIF